MRSSRVVAFGEDSRQLRLGAARRGLLVRMILPPLRGGGGDLMMGDSATFHRKTRTFAAPNAGAGA